MWHRSLSFLIMLTLGGGLVLPAAAETLAGKTRWTGEVMLREAVHVSPGATLTIAYPFVKRYISIPQFVLGAAFGWAVPMAFAAQTGEVPQLAWLIFLVVVVWATVYDTMYAMVDREDDLAIGLKSTAILFGDADVFVIGILQLALVAGLLMMGTTAGLGPWYWLGVAAAAASSVYQWRLIRKRNPDDCFKAFLNNSLLGAWVFVGILLHFTFTAQVPL